MPRKNTGAALATIHETAADLHRVGGMDQKTMRKFDALCLTPSKTTSILHMVRPLLATPPVKKHKLSKLLPLALLLSTHALISQSVPPPASSSSPPAASTPQVKLRLSETVSSATARVGQVILLEVVDPVQSNGKLVIAAGAPARASVSVARHRGHNHRDGKLLLTIQTLSRVDGTQAQLRSASLEKGSGKGAPIFGPCTFPFPADPVGLFRRGENVVIPKGTELVAALASEAP